eukprot:TRINITY_DN899_c0_g2_i1.p1 TRINITY_DN899_c0_g2~~TRINITY_DN899_c0_g2_i1.p1  ORF type:complete len:745 (+),score=138.06 TRINITY_DN899_c0_g2_i1:153-2387(+)
MSQGFVNSDTQATTMNNELVQVINGDAEFVPLESLRAQLSQLGFDSKGFAYSVVAILGCQSSGKSTLLNMLFGTSFPVMQAEHGRSQTTLGVWLGLSASGGTGGSVDESILVMDVEGVDSRERGEEHTAFERKTSLFSLALADVLIVNTWHNDIGRYVAGNVALLKIVFELNLQLFLKPGASRKLILFIIRDHVPELTPLSKLTDMIMSDMHSIWTSLPKPAAFGPSPQLSEFFEFRFTSLPHKVLRADQFVTDVDALRRKFVDASGPDYLLLAPSARQTSVPADGFAKFAENIWETIKANKDLNLPTEKEMLATYRCDEISQAALAKFSAAAEPLQQAQLRGELLQQFGQAAAMLLASALAEYDPQASRYVADIAQAKRLSLEKAVLVLLYSMFERQLTLLSQQVAASFLKSLAAKFPSDGLASRDFAKQASAARQASLDEFLHGAAEACLASAAAGEWTSEAALVQLQGLIDERIASAREEQIKALNKEVKADINSGYAKPFDKLLESAEPDALWPKLRQLHESVLTRAESFLLDRLQGFAASSTEQQQRVKELQDLAVHVLKSRFLEKTKFLQYILNKRFETCFGQDERGLPRRWKANDDVAAIFARSKRQAEQLLEAFCVLRLDPSLDQVDFLSAESTADPEPSLVILSPEEASALREQFSEAARSLYLQALRDQENIATVSRVPTYMIVLVLMLGFNEFLYILTNPMLLILLILAAGFASVVHFLNLSGPVPKSAKSAT